MLCASSGEYLGFSGTQASRRRDLTFQLSLLCSRASGTCLSSATVLSFFIVYTTQPNIPNSFVQDGVEELKGQVLHRGLTLVPMINSINEFEKAAIQINDEIEVKFFSQVNEFV